MDTLQRTEAGGGSIEPGRTVKAWDLPTRLFHVALITLVVLAWVSYWYGDENLVWHTWNGYGVLVLVVWRVLWGLVGSSTSRFAAFVRFPTQAARYAMDLCLGKPRRFLGHSPLGGWAVLAMVGLLGLQACLGLFSADLSDPLVTREGPLATNPPAWLSSATHWHHVVFDAIKLLVALHIAVVIGVYWLWKKDNLVLPMITGSKPAEDFEDQAEAKLAGGVRAILCLAAALVVVFGGIWAAGGKLF